jgi:hypothetical protein
MAINKYPLHINVSNFKHLALRCFHIKTSLVTDDTGANPGEGLTSVEDRRMLGVRAAVHAQLRPE